MIAVQIEKEIKEENKVVGRFTLRQVVCFGIALIILAIYYFFVKPTMDMFVPAAIILGAGVWYFGFHTINGMHTEYFVIKSIKETVQMNLNRRYRSRNNYVVLLNDSYKSDRQEDMSDPRKRRYLKKRERFDRRRHRKTKLVSYR